MLQEQYKDNINILLQKIQEAESIVVGGAAGMSAACGYNWYSSNDENFIKHFGSFIEKYGIDNMFNGFYYRFSTREERWAYMATLNKFVYDSEVGQTYLDLEKLLKNKDKKILFLELGVGTMTPMFIKEPFWRMTHSIPNAYYISINPNDAVVPTGLEGKGLAITEDISKIFQD